MSIIRLATLEDIDELVRMRWEFSEEENSDSTLNYEEFHQTCYEFLVKAMKSGDWYIWVAEDSGSIVSHMYLQLIHKVPRPGKSPDPYYGRPTYIRDQHLEIKESAATFNWPWSIGQKKIKSSSFWFGRAAIVCNFTPKMASFAAMKRWKSIFNFIIRAGAAIACSSFFARSENN